jgi:hypothetical protein
MRPSIPAAMVARSGRLPRAQGWSFEVKWDGFRAIVCTHDGLRVRSRRGRNVARLVPELADLPDGLMLDGELVAWEDGLPSFPRLCQSPASPGSRLASKAQSSGRRKLHPAGSCGLASQCGSLAGALPAFFLVGAAWELGDHDRAQHDHGHHHEPVRADPGRQATPLPLRKRASPCPTPGAAEALRRPPRL